MEKRGDTKSGDIRERERERGRESERKNGERIKEWIKRKRSTRLLRSPRFPIETPLRSFELFGPPPLPSRPRRIHSRFSLG